MALTIDPISERLLILFGGMMLWSVKGYITEKTRTRRATDQPVTMGEMESHCEKEHLKITEDVTKEITHVKQLVQVDLDHGKKRFDQLDTAVQGIHTEVRDIMTIVVNLKT